MHYTIPHVNHSDSEKEFTSSRLTEQYDAYNLSGRDT